MQISLVALSMLTAHAAAWRNPWGNGNWGPPQGSPDCSSEISDSLPTAVPTEAPVPTVIPSVVPPPVDEVPTTLFTRTITLSTAPIEAPSSSAVVQPEPEPEPAPTSTAADPAPTGSLTADQQAGLDSHNAARAEVGTADLVWDDELAAGAQEWATHLVSVGNLVHSGADGVGENLYMQSGDGTPYKNAVDAFVSEKSSYNGEVIDGSNYQTFGHYTQVVWSSTTNVGMAIATGSNGETYVVARYSPPGNFIGESPY